MKEKMISINLRASNIRAAIVQGGAPGNIFSQRIYNGGTLEEVLEDVFAPSINVLMSNEVPLLASVCPALRI